MTEEQSQQVTTAVIVLGDAMFFQPDSDNAMSVTVSEKKDLATSLGNVAPSSISAVHIVTRNAGLTTLYDGEAVQSHIVPRLRDDGELTVHVLGDAVPGADEQQPVQPEDVEHVKLSLIMANLRIEAEQEGQDGSRTIMGKKQQGA